MLRAPKIWSSRKSIGRILSNSILINGSLPESLVNFRGDLIREMIARGHVVHASAPDIDGRTLDTLDGIGVKSHSLSLDRSGLNPASDFRYFREMIKLMRAVEPDLVINYTIKPNIWGSLAARLLGIPVCSMVTGIGYLMLEGEGIKRRVVQGLAKWLYTCLLYTSPSPRD